MNNPNERNEFIKAAMIELSCETFTLGSAAPRRKEDAGKLTVEKLAGVIARMASELWFAYQAIADKPEPIEVPWPAKDCEPQRDKLGELEVWIRSKSRSEQLELSMLYVLDKIQELRGDQ